MGGAPSQQFGTDYLSLTPEQQQQIQGGLSGVQVANAGANAAAQNAQNGLNTNFSGNVPNLNQYATGLNTEFAGPNFSTDLDATSKNLISQQNQQAANQLAGQRTQIAQQFGASNPGLAQVLQSQAGAQSALANNGNAFQAQLAQQARQAQVYQLSQQAQAQTNQARLAQSQNNSGLAAQQANFGFNAQNASNAALMNQAQLGQVGFQNNQSLLSIMSALAALQGAHVSAATGSVPNTGLGRPGEQAPAPAAPPSGYNSPNNPYPKGSPPWQVWNNQHGV